MNLDRVGTVVGVTHNPQSVWLDVQVGGLVLKLAYQRRGLGRRVMAAVFGCVPQSDDDVIGWRVPVSVGLDGNGRVKAHLLPVAGRGPVAAAPATTALL